MTMYNTLLKNKLFSVLEQGVSKGTLTAIAPDGSSRTVGGKEPGPAATWHIHDWSVIPIISSRGDVGLGESYTSGLWDTPDLEALFAVFILNVETLDRYANGSWLSKCWFRVVNHCLRRNSIEGSSENIRAHYDVGNDFYQLWLDPGMTYSSALFTDKTLSLEEAQREKYQRLLNRIETSRTRLLEIGCGWGGFAEAAAHKGHEVTGITISPEQHAFASKRLGNSATIQLLDYRNMRESFDAIASIEMFEAVGRRYWPDYFRTIKNCLKKEGIAMVQTITIRDDVFAEYSKRGDYIRQYVFPGGFLPSIHSFRTQAEQVGLVCRDVFHFGQDYARTLKEWLVRFNQSEEAILALGYSPSFIRSWRLYLAMCAASFSCQRTNVVQVELAHA